MHHSLLLRRAGSCGFNPSSASSLRFASYLRSATRHDSFFASSRESWRLAATSVNSHRGISTSSVCLSAAAADAGAAAVSVKDSIDGPMFASPRSVRNIAVIAHVDHGKTSLVDCLLRFCEPELTNASMDSNPLEQERGITILAKCTSLKYKGLTFNIVDTPGHADFGGEVERVLSMVDGVLLVVCAQEGPMPQTRYVLSKATARGLPAVVILNKADREGARIGGPVENEVFDLFAALDATDEQLEFPVVYASAREGWAVPSVEEIPKGAGATTVGGGKTASARSTSSGTSPTLNFDFLLKTLAERVPSPRILGPPEAPMRMLVTQMDHSDFIGRLLIGRIASGSIRPGDAIRAVDREGVLIEEGKVTKLFTRRGSTSVPLDVGYPGDIVQVAGLSKPLPTSTISAPEIMKPLHADAIDPPTLAMAFCVNDAPGAGKEGTRLTSTVIADRLYKESATNVALQIAPAESIPGMPDAMEVRGRGELQLAVLIENMRREGFELSVSPPAVLFKTAADGEILEPYENVVIDVDEVYSGAVIERLAQRKGVMKDFAPIGGKNSGKVRLVFGAPSRGLIGFTSELKADTRGTANLHRSYDSYGPKLKGLDRKQRAVMVSNCAGQITAYALDLLQARGTLFVPPGSQTYNGHIIGECSRDSLYDMSVNPVRAKKLTNVRAAGHDDAVRLPPPRIFSLEEAIVWVAPDELVEVTPSHIRMRKRILDEGERDRLSRSAAKAAMADQ